MKRHSLFFGVNDYAPGSGFRSLRCPVPDVEAMAKLFADPEISGPSTPPRVLPNRTHDQAKRDVRNLLFDPVFDPRNDLIHIHFSGHGSKDDNGILYLCFKDAHCEELSFTALPISDLKKWLDSRNVQRALITLDCCYSGAAIDQFKDSLNRESNALSRDIPTANEQGGQGKGYQVITASSDIELAKQGPELSLFTYHLIDGVKSGAADIDGKGWFTATDLFDHITRALAAETAGQTPHIGGKTRGSFSIGMNPKVRAQREAEAAAAAAEAASRATTELRRRTLEVMRARIADGTFDPAFVAEVEAFLERLPQEALNGERHHLIRRFLDRDISAVAFHGGWSRIGVAPRVEPVAEPPSTGRSAAETSGARSEAIGTQPSVVDQPSDRNPETE